MICGKDKRIDRLRLFVHVCNHANIIPKSIRIRGISFIYIGRIFIVLNKSEFSHIIIEPIIIAVVDNNITAFTTFIGSFRAENGECNLCLIMATTDARVE